MKNKLQEHKIHFGTFDFAFHCVVGSYDLLPKYLAKRFEESEEEMYELYSVTNKGYEPRGKYFYKPGYCPVIWIPRKPKTPREIATLAHEILHIVYRLLHWAGIPLTEDTEEVRTHAQSFALTELLSKIK